MKLTFEKIADTADFNNGSGPMWCYGSSTIARLGDTVYATVPLLDEKVTPLSNTHMTLYRKKPDMPWEQIYVNPNYNREPCPLMRYNDTTLVVTANPSEAGTMYGPAKPGVLLFDLNGNITEMIPPVWDEDYKFMDHSYRGSSVDIAYGGMFLANQYVTDSGGEHCYAYYDGNDWTHCGKLDYDVRSCYPNVQLKGKSVHILAISDIIEPNPEWRAFKKEITGRDWDYDFRNLYYKYTNDVTKDPPCAPILIDSREETCGWISNHDIHADDSGTCHVLYSTKRMNFPQMKEKFFPDTEFDVSLEYKAVKDGKIIHAVTLDFQTKPISYCGAFHIAENGELKIIYCKNDGYYITDFENTTKIETSLKPATFFTARNRLGNLQSDIIDLYLQSGNEIIYGKVEL
ncbi:MAG: hypothetical protein FWF15_04190 [Oscillospiraceae bacterium]|nr:hypothetical protein [Oscillospiraceae bacterium]